MATILIVDDEKNIRRTLQMVLQGVGFDTLEAGSAEEALARLEHDDVDLLILDVRLPKMSGLQALDLIRARPEWTHLPVIVISGHATVPEAVAAVQRGATDFFEKPLDRDRVLVTVKNALTTSQLKKEVAQWRANFAQRHEMIGESAVMQRLYAELEKVGPTKGRVLITGESGTGKELIARAIHRLSPRREEAFVKVNCAAIPAELIESELFGYEKGAFTGAASRKKGVFEQAHGGTLFLDEIGDMSLNAQAKVLRALQSGEVSRVGSERSINVDVRVLAATNRDLEASVAQGTFREDLYFRLSVVPIRSPALRERRQDIPALVRTFARTFAAENDLKEKPFDQDAQKLLTERPWPGNVRELRNMVERLMILSADRVTAADVPDAGKLKEPDAESRTPRAAGHADESLGLSLVTGEERPSLKEFREHAEATYIKHVLNGCDWNISKAAGVLGVERTNLHKKMRSLGIRRSQ